MRCLLEYLQSNPPLKLYWYRDFIAVTVTNSVSGCVVASVNIYDLVLNVVLTDLSQVAIKSFHFYWQKSPAVESTM